jgi:hypothetical protein
MEKSEGKAYRATFKLNSWLVAGDINIKDIRGRERDFSGRDLNERALSVIEF